MLYLKWVNIDIFNFKIIKNLHKDKVSEHSGTPRSEISISTAADDEDGDQSCS